MEQWDRMVYFAGVIGGTGGVNINKYSEPVPYMSDWMGASWIQDQRLFYDLSIPGTHQSGSYVYNNYFEQASCTQVWTIPQQLAAGIRFFDLRMKSSRDGIMLIHLTPPISGGLLLQTVMDQFVAFLRAHPTEVVIVRIAEAHQPAMNLDLQKVAAEIGVYRHWLCSECTVDSLVSFAKGKIVIATEVPLPSGYGLPYNHIWTEPYLQDSFNVERVKDSYEKWVKIRRMFQAATTNIRPQRNRYLNHVSASGGRSPYDCASGFYDYTNVRSFAGLVLWYPEVDEWYRDFLRVNCVCFFGTVCSIFYRGYNDLAFRWITNGVYYSRDPYVLQSADTNVWYNPRALGVVSMDYPSRELIMAVVIANIMGNVFAGYMGYRYKIQPSYVMENCFSCVAGDTEVLTGRGIVAARDVTASDSLVGVDGGSCAVVAVTKVTSNGTAHGQFTADHLVAQNNLSGVVAHGRVQEVRHVDLVNIATTCPLTATADGTYFTPISTVFCPQLSMTQYMRLYGAIMSIVAQTGTFWFDPSIYRIQPRERRLTANATETWAVFSSVLRDDENATMGNATMGNVTSPVKTSFDDLPAVCGAMLMCVTSSTTCDEFEQLATAWMVEQLPPTYMAAVRAAFPSLGSALSPGSLSGSIWSPDHALAVGAGVAGALLVVFAAIGAVVGVVLWKRRVQRRRAEVDASPSAEVKPVESA